MGASCLYRLGCGDYLYTVAEMTGVGIPTVCSIVNEVCQILVDHLWSECISSQMPKTQDEKNTIIIVLYLRAW